MKTKNNVQKAILRSVAVITSFVLLSLTVTAQGYWKQLLTNNSFNQIATALVENPAPAEPDENPATNHSAVPADFNLYHTMKPGNRHLN